MGVFCLFWNTLYFLKWDFDPFIISLFFKEIGGILKSPLQPPYNPPNP